ncbi:CPBP family intramembrane metalloprotease [Georgenia sp. EYE_87]|uniref:CPBP family glutamic-type intramembrane protease n=1 Tax=Georgenia sp. EYE_87 TaxID=2853448 RepID=UPI0020057BE6|nr:type II CAAX endopeptidase family protein [Georgenia sp. EYE_87]MCK6211679.1 CPBP family intramembrane metalloprotease [Georgenia sp. EYE_87]
MALKSWVRTRPVLAFYVLAFTITWLSWWPMAAHNRGLIAVDVPGLFVLGGLGPGIAAWAVMRAVSRADAAETLLRPLLRWRVSVRWFVVAACLFPAIWILAAVLSGSLTAELAALGSVPVVVMALLRYVIAAVPEEAGWRGFALPALQVRHSALTSSLVVGLLWALWHLPLLLGGDPTMSTYPLVPYVVWVVAEAVLYTWLYNSTSGSLLVVVLLHGVTNVVGLFGSAPWLVAVLTTAAAIVVVAVCGPEHLARNGRRVTLRPVAGLPGSAASDASGGPGRRSAR